MLGRLRIFIILIVTILGAPQILAHPHILIDAKIKFHINEKNELTKLSYVWHFDENFSLLLLGDYDEDENLQISDKELETLLKETMDGAQALKFFTHLKQNDVKYEKLSMKNLRGDLIEDRLIFKFDLTLSEAQKLDAKTEFALFDEEYYSAMMMDLDQDLSVEQQADNCSLKYTKKAKIDDNLENALANAFNQDNINQGFGAQFANKIGFTCNV